MRMVMFDSRRYDREAFDAANASGRHEITYLEPRLTPETAALAGGYPAVCSFVSDRVDDRVLEELHAGGTRVLLLRSAGFNHVDLRAAARLAVPVLRVPEYSPYAVAEHAVALVLALNRHIHRAHARVREGNFSLDGLAGFDLHGKTAGVIGLGRIGQAAARIFLGFGCRVLGYDLVPHTGLAGAPGFRQAGLHEVYAESDIISLHVPLTPSTRHMIDDAAISRMKPGVYIINTGRGALIDSMALIRALKTRRIGAAGLDVYEEEEGVFFEDLSNTVLQDDVLARLLTFPNVIVTAHQAFLTREALHNIASVTLDNLTAFEEQRPLVNAVRPSG
ncbi:MAG: D-lactate dehydrogenase [Myxococcota bacterium]|nr:D-lactate dehydrogenase [Myxococcota bacterium]